MKEDGDRSIRRSGIPSPRSHGRLGRHGVWAPDAKPIWASGMCRANRPDTRPQSHRSPISLRNFLHYGGRPNM